MPTLTQIILKSAATMADVVVIVDRRFSVVTVQDPAGINDDLTLQGDEAREFIDELDRLWLEAKNVTKDEVAKHLVFPYVECLWG